MNCFVVGFTQITSFSTMFFILYILSEYVWEKPNDQENDPFDHDTIISLLREYKKENYKKSLSNIHVLLFIITAILNFTY